MERKRAGEEEIEGGIIRQNSAVSISPLLIAKRASGIYNITTRTIKSRNTAVYSSLCTFADRIQEHPNLLLHTHTTHLNHWQRSSLYLPRPTHRIA